MTKAFINKSQARKNLDGRRVTIKKGQVVKLFQVKEEASLYVKRNFGDVIKKLSNQ